MKINDDLQAMIQSVAGDLGYMIDDVVLIIHGRSPRITVKIDHLQGISHSDCERFSKELSHRIDSRKLLDDYVLEISSPGLKRELRTIDDYIRFIGAPVKGVYMEDDVRKTFKGQLEKVDNAIVTIDEGQKIIVVPYMQIVKANLDY